MVSVVTAAVPDPSFRDQLAEANGWSVAEVEDAILADLQPRLDESDAAWVVRTFVAPLARELARVQAAANQREAETLIQLADAWDENASRWYYEHRHTHPNGIGWVGGFEEGWGEGARLLRARAAALASPAPAPQDGGAEEAVRRELAIRRALSEQTTFSALDGEDR